MRDAGGRDIQVSARIGDGSVDGASDGGAHRRRDGDPAGAHALDAGAHHGDPEPLGRGLRRGQGRQGVRRRAQVHEPQAGVEPARPPARRRSPTLGFGRRLFDQRRVQFFCSVVTCR